MNLTPTAARTMAADARSQGQAQCCLSTTKDDEINELCLEEIAKGK